MNDSSLSDMVKLVKRSLFFSIVFFLSLGEWSLVWAQGYQDSLYVDDPNFEILVNDPAKDTTYEFLVYRKVDKSACKKIGVKSKLSQNDLGNVKLGFRTPVSINKYLPWGCDYTLPLQVVYTYRKNRLSQSNPEGSLQITQPSKPDNEQFQGVSVPIRLKGVEIPRILKTGKLVLIETNNSKGNTEPLVLHDNESQSITLMHEAGAGAAPLQLAYTISPPNVEELLSLTTSEGQNITQRLTIPAGASLPITITQQGHKGGNAILIFNDIQKESNKITFSLKLTANSPEPSMLGEISVQTARMYAILFLLLVILVVVGIYWYANKQKKKKEEKTGAVQKSASDPEHGYFADDGPPSTVSTSVLKPADQLQINQAFWDTFVKVAKKKKGRNLQKEPLIRQTIEELKKLAKKTSKALKHRQPNSSMTPAERLSSVKRKNNNIPDIDAAIETASEYFASIRKEEILKLDTAIKNNGRSAVLKELQGNSGIASQVDPKLGIPLLENIFDLGASLEQRKKIQINSKKEDTQVVLQVPETNSLSEINKLKEQIEQLQMEKTKSTEILDNLTAELDKAKKANQKSEDEIIQLSQDLEKKVVRINTLDSELKQASDLLSSIKEELQKNKEYLTIFQAEHPITWKKILGFSIQDKSAEINHLQNYALELSEFLRDLLLNNYPPEVSGESSLANLFRKPLQPSTEERLEFISELATGGETLDEGLQGYLSNESKPEEGLKNYVEDRLYDPINEQLIYLEELGHLDKFHVDLDEAIKDEVKAWSKDRSSSVRNRLAELTGIEVAEIELFQEFSKELENNCKWGTDQDKLDDMYREIDLEKQRVKEIKKIGYQRGGNTVRSEVIIS